jgi:EF-hand domain pair
MSGRGANFALTLLVVVGVLSVALLGVGSVDASPLRQKNDLRLLFDLRLDQDHDGVLTVGDLVQWSHVMDDLPTENDPFPENPDVDPQQITDLFAELDVNHDGEVTYDEFKINFSRLDHPYPQPTEVHLSLTSDPSEMVVMWLTQRKLC